MILISDFITPLGAIHTALIIAAIATVSSPAVIAAVIKQVRSHGRVSRLLRYITGFDNIIGVITFGLAYPFFHITSRASSVTIPGWGWLLISIAVGLALGMLFHFFTTPRASSNENLMIAVGMVALSSGLASYLSLSALFINLIVGIVLCNYSERQDRFYRLLISAEKPLYGVLLIIAGALWRATWLMAVLAAIFILFRATAKTLGTWASLRNYSSIVRNPGWLGTALIAQGGIALAIALDFRFLAPGEISNLIVSITLTGLTINAFVCPFTAKHVLKIEGEIA